MQINQKIPFLFVKKMTKFLRKKTLLLSLQ